MEHLSDKELIRQGRYHEALGNNYNPKPYEVYCGKTGKDLTGESFTTAEDANEKCKELGIVNYVLYNANADWL